MKPVSDASVSRAVELQPGKPAGVQRMHRRFMEALERTATAVRDEAYVFAGHPVRLRVVGAELAARTQRAFGHLRGGGTDRQPPSLRIDLWEETETGITGPDAASTDLERSWVACGGMLTASADGSYVSFRYRDSVTVLDRRGQRMIGCRRDGSHLSSGEYSKPLLLMLSIWYRDRGVQHLHAGLIARHGAGVLVPGDSGSGKSTMSLASVDQGLDFLGDDFVGLERTEEGSFVGHSIFNTACIARKDLDRFPAIRSYAVEESFPEEEKPILFLSEVFPDRIQRAVPVRAVALLRIGNDRTQVRPARPAEALRQFAASTLHTVVPRPGREALELIGELVAHVPAYWLLLGPGLREIPRSIDEILTRANGGDVA